MFSEVLMNFEWKNRKAQRGDNFFHEEKSRKGKQNKI